MPPQNLTTATVQRELVAARSHNLFLDWLRAIAALLVLFTHVRGAVYVKWSDLDVTSQSHLNYVLFFVTRLGREAVVIFFVLSGYLVGGCALNAWRADRYSPGEYFIARISRLYVVVLPALLVTGLLDYVRDGWSGGDHRAYDFWINVFFLQDIFGGTYGSNGPLWSLSYEWWFYVLWGFGLTAVAGAPRRLKALSVLIIVGIFAVLAIRCPGILWMFPLWLLGVSARGLPVPGRYGAVIFPLALIALILSVVISTTRWDGVGDALVGVACAVLVYSTRSLKSREHGGRALGTRLAAFSFSLYAFHPPLNALLVSIFVPERLHRAGVLSWGAWLMLVLVEILVCWGLFWIFERRTSEVREALSRGLRQHLRVGRAVV